MTYRNPHLLKACRELACQQCGAEDGTVVAAHSNQLRDGKGRAIKAADYRVAALCRQCHHDIDQGAILSKADRRDAWERAHRKTIGALFESGLLQVRK